MKLVLCQVPVRGVLGDVKRVFASWPLALCQMHSNMRMQIEGLLVCAGSSVAAGAVNCEGRIVVRAERCGNATALADIVHAVEAAQARAAPVQRLADRVAGCFAFGVLGLSTATFAFWAAAGPRLFPQACSTLCLCSCSSCVLLYKGAVGPGPARQNSLTIFMVMALLLACWACSSHFLHSGLLLGPGCLPRCFPYALLPCIPCSLP